MKTKSSHREVKIKKPVLVKHKRRVSYSKIAEQCSAIFNSQCDQPKDT